MHHAAGYGCKAVALWRRAVLLALLGLGWLTLTLLARTRHKPRRTNKIADRLADRKLAPCSRLRVQGRSSMAALLALLALLGVAWRCLARVG